QPAVLARRASMVPRAGPRRLLRSPRLHEGAVPTSGSAVHGHGVRHRDDHQGKSRRREDRRSPDYVASRRPEEPSAAPQDVSRRLANAAILPDVLSAPAVSPAWSDVGRAGHRRLHGGDAQYDQHKPEDRRVGTDYGWRY